jgi:hypothetical protein
MRKPVRTLLLAVFLVSVCALAAMAQAQAPAKTAPAAGQHIMIMPDQLKWGPAPPSLPAGAQMAVLEGDPTKRGLFTMRLKMPDG